jgi:predicted phosphodiesterase
MKVAVLADVHGNLEALAAVLEDLEKEGVDKVLFLGDAVGYGADPGACLELLEKAACQWVAGNHDHAAAQDQEAIEDLHEDAAAAILWTRGVLSPDARGRLRKLSLDSVNEEARLVHGSPWVPGKWQYVMSVQDAEKGFAACENRVILVGHTHIPAAYVEFECRRLFTGVMRRIGQTDPTSVEIDPAHRYILNVGSVGQPRDGDPRACYALFDREAGSYAIRRIPYDVDRASEKIRKAGLPVNLAERIKSGH